MLPRVLDQALWARLKSASALAADSHIVPIVDVLCRWGQENDLVDVACEVLQSFLSSAPSSAPADDDDSAFQSKKKPAPGRGGSQKRGRATAGAAASTTAVAVDAEWAMNPVVALRCLETVLAGNPGGARDRMLQACNATPGARRGAEQYSGGVQLMVATLTRCRDALVAGLAAGDGATAMAQAAVSATATRVLAKLYLHLSAVGSTAERLVPNAGLKAMMVRVGWWWWWCVAVWQYGSIGRQHGTREKCGESGEAWYCCQRGKGV